MEFLLFRAATMENDGDDDPARYFQRRFGDFILASNMVLSRIVIPLLVDLIRVVGDEERRVSRGAGDATRVLAKRRFAVGLRKQKARVSFAILAERVFGERAFCTTQRRKVKKRKSVQRNLQENSANVRSPLLQ